MSAAKRARLIAPVAQQHSSVRATSEDELCLNDMLKSCALPVNNLHATVESLVRKHLADFHELMLNHAISEADANNGWFIDPATASTTTNPLDTNSGFGAAATTPSPPSFVRKRYWDLGPDKLMLARAAAQQVDQLLPALDVLESNVSALTDWKRRANAYFAATQYMVHDQWSLSPRLPKHIAVQARFTNDGRLIWRYGGSEHEDMPATPDLGLVGASDGLQRVHDQFVHRTEQEVRDLLNLLPYRVREAIDEIPDAVHSLNEVVLDLGEPPRLRFFALNQAALDLKDVGRVTQEDIDAIVDGRKFSSDRRGGINGQLHRISWVANREGKAIGLTIRVGRACPPGEGVTQMLLDLVKRGESVLFLGKPGSGKTHTLRDFVARLSDTGNNVMIVDTSNEVGGPGDVKHFSLHKARRLQVRDRSRQFEVLLEAVQNHTPDIVCIDEISDSKEVAAARSVATRVKGTVATAHGDLESILRNKVMRELLGGLQTATVGDARAKELGGRKTVTTRAEESLFTTVVELVSRTEVRVFQNVGHVVDAILHPHGFPWAERRWLATPDGSVSGTSAGGHKFFLVQVEPLEKPDLEGP
ncbi:hypothetical protein BCR44DRAFT_42190 [Catenaria anguillulae PL171]|uniref:AAA+ ATPase domain-containing protein n=1 Tax=Catenaria anguillulae PL171 TaxID=765915 RepID=A0A1Y2HQ72_9FUNG|nr:hypothetical protein BCR44DRAFT_42190 [Catenaria anguillulae PL171]